MTDQRGSFGDCAHALPRPCFVIINDCHSYCNFLIANGVVIVPQFGDSG